MYLSLKTKKLTILLSHRHSLFLLGEYAMKLCMLQSTSNQDVTENVRSPSSEK